MGDRGNVYVKNHEGGIYLYTHWRGSELPEIVRNTLARRQRWDDESYLARMVFCDMSKGDHDNDRGYGISNYRTDNQHPIVVIDCEAQTVGFAHEDKEPECYESWTFEKYIAEKEEKLERLFNGG